MAAGARSVETMLLLLMVGEVLLFDRMKILLGKVLKVCQREQHRSMLKPLFHFPEQERSFFKWSVSSLYGCGRFQKGVVSSLANVDMHLALASGNRRTLGGG